MGAICRVGALRNPGEPELHDTGLNSVTVIDGWYNDLKTPRTLAQLQADLRALCAWVKSKGDLLYVNHAKLNPSQVDGCNL